MGHIDFLKIQDFMQKIIASSDWLWWGASAILRGHIWGGGYVDV